MLKQSCICYYIICMTVPLILCFQKSYHFFRFPSLMHFKFPHCKIKKFWKLQSDLANGRYQCEKSVDNLLDVDFEPIQKICLSFLLLIFKMRLSFGSMLISDHVVFWKTLRNSEGNLYDRVLFVLELLGRIPT